jgi:tetratricopeptide (TPR) repeat protein
MGVHVHGAGRVGKVVQIGEITVESGGTVHVGGAAAYSAEFPVWSLPLLQNPHFVGRDEELAMLSTSPSLAVVVCGLGGVGKTELCAEFAHRHRADFDVVWWVRASEALSMQADMADLAMAVGVGDPADQPGSAEHGRRWLMSTKRSWLVVFDNAESPPDLEGALPTGAAASSRLIVTSRRTDWPRAITIRLSPFNGEVGANFLRRRSGSDDHPAALRISNALGGLPLALAQASAYVMATAVSLATYSERLTSGDALLTPASGEEQSVATVWKPSVERVMSEDPTAVELLELMSLLAPDPIPRWIFERVPGREVGWNRLEVDHAVASLRRFSLIDTTPDGDIQVHRLVQSVTAARLADLRATRQRLVEFLVTLDRGESSGPEVRSWWAALSPHLLWLTSTVDSSDPRWAATLFRLGRFQFSAGYYAVAARLHEAVVTSREQFAGPDHVDTLEAKSYLAEAAYAAGEFARSRDLLAEIIAVRSDLLGAAHPDTLEAKLSLAAALHALGDPEARPLTEEVVGQYELTLGPDDLTTLGAKSELASQLRVAGELEAARRLAEQVLAGRERQLGADNMLTIGAKTNLANILRAMGELPAARQLHEETLAALEPTLGPNHPTTLIVMSNLGNVLAEMGDTTTAKAIHDHVLSAFVETLGSDHPTSIKAQLIVDSYQPSSNDVIPHFVVGGDGAPFSSAGRGCGWVVAAAVALALVICAAIVALVVWLV